MSTCADLEMASMALEQLFRCCICLDVYSEPVSIPCGHNFCLDCIEGFWDTKDESECPLCKETFSSRPKLRVNHEFSDIIPLFKSLQPEQWEDMAVRLRNRRHGPDQLPEADGVSCDVCQGDEFPAVRSCLDCRATFCQSHLAPHLSDPDLQGHRLTDPSPINANGTQLCRDHELPLLRFCRSDRTPVCVRCAERNHKQHKVVPLEKEIKKVKIQLQQTKSLIHQLSQDRLRKVEEIKNSVDQSKKNTQKEIQSSAQDCSRLIRAIERNQAELVEELEQQQEEVERRGKEVLEELQQELNQLQARSSELQQLELSLNPLELLQSFPSLSQVPLTRDWSQILVHPDTCTGAGRRAASKLLDVSQQLVNTRSAAEAEKMNRYAVDVVLDPATASGWLIVSPDEKKVSVSYQKKNFSGPDDPKRFDACVCVLGKQSFSSGRHYWLVQVGDKTDWDLGVARASINRKGAITVRPDAGYWAISRRKGGSLSACTSPSLTLNLRDAPQKVGVFLDYDGGSVSFFNVDAKTHIYTFGGCVFGEPLHPYFNPCVQSNGRNTTPLVICPVEAAV